MSLTRASLSSELSVHPETLFRVFAEPIREDFVETLRINDEIGFSVIRSLKGNFFPEDAAIPAVIGPHGYQAECFLEKTKDQVNQIFRVNLDTGGNGLSDSTRHTSILCNIGQQR